MLDQVCRRDRDRRPGAAGKGRTGLRPDDQIGTTQPTNLIPNHPRMTLWRRRQRRHGRRHPGGSAAMPDKETTMRDDPSQHILAALDRLEAGQAKMRTDIMHRIDRLQHIVEMTRDDITVNFGNTGRVERIANGAVDDRRTTTEILRVMQRQIMRRQTDVQQWKGPS
jgi:hypothetical protein